MITEAQLRRRRRREKRKIERKQEKQQKTGKRGITRFQNAMIPDIGEFLYKYPGFKIAFIDMDYVVVDLTSCTVPVAKYPEGIEVTFPINIPVPYPTGQPKDFMVTLRFQSVDLDAMIKQISSGYIAFNPKRLCNKTALGQITKFGQEKYRPVIAELIHNQDAQDAGSSLMPAPGP
jgi:hypothetical protein